MLFSLLKYYLKLYVTETALKVSRSLYFFTTSISHGVENYFLGLWGMGISDSIFFVTSPVNIFECYSFYFPGNFPGLNIKSFRDLV